MSKVTTEQQVLEDVRNQIEHYDAVVEGAREAAEQEKDMTLRQGLRKYPKAVAWSMALSMAIVMEGFDIVLLASFYAQPQFAQKYGEQTGPNKWEIPAKWQAGLSNGVQVGSIIGLTLNGWASERFGYKRTLMVALSAMIAFIFIPFFAPSIEVLLVGQILQGIPWGCFQTLTTAYAAEVCPVALRPYLTAFVNLCWVIGQLIASGVLRAVLPWENQWAYRVPFAMQWIWPLPILIAATFAPESPWWLVRVGRHEDARRQIRRLNTDPTEQDVDNQLSLMIHTNALEKSMSAGTSFKDCFTGIDRRRTEIAAGAWAVQNMCGSAFMGYSTYFLSQAGLPTEQAFNLAIGQYALGICGTLSSWFLMTYFGRRRLYLVGLMVLLVLLVAIGGAGFVSQTSTSAQWAIGAMLLVYTAIYDATLGPVCYALVAEMPSTRLRAKTVVIARIVYNICGIIINIIMPYFLNSQKLNWGGKTGLFWAGFCVICLIWTYFRVPEPRGRTYGELDVLFENKVSARKFASTKVDQFAGHETASPVTEDIDEKLNVKATKGEVAHLEY